MVLNDYINQVCLTVNRIDNDSRAAAASFIANRYKMIYDAYPWHDSEIVSPPTASVPGQDPFAPTGTSIAFPTGFDRIVKVGLITSAGGTRAISDLRPMDSAALLETRPDVFLGSGTPEFWDEILIANGRYIQIYPQSNNNNFLFIFVGKKICNTLVNSNDAPILRNIDNALIAFAIGDMLKRDRHYAKAQQQLTEAQAILQEAIAVEQKQSNQPRAARPLSVTGGTLDELKDAVASRLSMWDAQAGNKIKEAIRRNYQELYDRELWTESIDMMSIQAQGQQIILPEYIDKVIVVNNQSFLTIDVVELEYLFRTNPSIFDSTGPPVVYTVMPPVAVRVVPETDEQLVLVSDNINDTFPVSINGISNGLEANEIVNVGAGGTGISANPYLYPFMISKPPSLGTLTISGASSLTKFGTIPPDQSYVQHQRIWVQPTDTDTFNGSYFVVGKRKIQQLINPTDAVQVKGCENTLISMACSEVATDPAQATAFKAEAEAKMQTLIARETNQQSRRATITPFTDRWTFTTDGFADWIPRG